MIRFLGRSRLWLEVVGHRFGEVAQWERLEGGSRCGNVLGGWGVGAIEQGGGRDTEKRGGGTGEGVLESGELVAPPFAYTGSGVSLGHLCNVKCCGCCSTGCALICDLLW